jgi:hypothetical protein
MIIFDASTLILLARTGILEVFISNFSGRVFIPEKVKEEVLAKDNEGAPEIAALIESGRIAVLRSRDNKVQRKLMKDFSIDLGEAEAIALALHEKGAVVATDDGSAIRACKLLKLDFVTAVVILIRATERNLFSKGQALSKLEKLESIGRYKKAIITNAKRQIRGGDENAGKDLEHTHE